MEVAIAAETFRKLVNVYLSQQKLIGEPLRNWSRKNYLRTTKGFDGQIG
jgi:hypothetical protein